MQGSGREQPRRLAWISAVGSLRCFIANCNHRILSCVIKGGEWQRGRRAGVRPAVPTTGPVRLDFVERAFLQHGCVLLFVAANKVKLASSHLEKKGGGPGCGEDVREWQGMRSLIPLRPLSTRSNPFPAIIE